MKSKKANHRRLKNIVVFKGVQFKLAFLNLFYLVLIAGVIVLAILSPLYYGMTDAQDPWHMYSSAKLFRLVLERMGLAIVVITIFSFIHSILLSHKFFGPLINIRHTITKMAEGDFSRKIYLRKGDYLKNEAQHINAMMATLSDSIEELGKDHDKMMRIIDNEMSGTDKDSEIGLKLRRVKRYAGRCQDRLNFFTFRSNELRN